MLGFKHNCMTVEEDLPMPFEDVQVVTHNQKIPQPNPDSTSAPHFLLKNYLSWNLVKDGFVFFLVFELAK